MTLDVRGSLKNTRISKNPFVVFEELLSNAIDSYLIRGKDEKVPDPFKVGFEIEFVPSTLFNDAFDMSITCSDNGAGLTNAALEAFLTKDTSYKDDLSVGGLGHCKGSGRIQYFHYFQFLKIDSVYQDGDSRLRRNLFFDGSSHLIAEEDFRISETPGDAIETTVKLSRLTPNVAKIVASAGDIKAQFSAEKIRDHLLVTFMQRLIALSGKLQDFEISVSGNGPEDSSPQVIKPSNLPLENKSIKVDIPVLVPATGEETAANETIKITQYKLKASDFNLPKNVVSLCAKHSPVQDITSRYLKDRTSERNNLSGYYHIVLLEGEVLDTSVNEQRDGFDLPDSLPTDDMFEVNGISYDAIYENIDDPIIELLGPADWSREEVVVAMTKKFGISEQMREETDTRIRHGESARSVVERVLKKYQDKIIEGTSEIFDLKEAVENAEPDSELFRQKLDELAWKYANEIDDLDKANLSQLVVRRSAIVEVLDLAVNKRLKMQVNLNGKKRKDEALIHNIFFPMRADSEKADNHDIWLLDEEYQYYDYIASDTPLANIAWGENDCLFEADVDDELKKLLDKNTDENNGKRPDIALFHEEGAAIIIEFKSPGVSMDDHTGDLMEYAQLLAAKSRGRLKRFYGYLIGDTVNPNRLRGFNRFPVGQGFFGTEAIMQYESQKVLGELYSEIVFFDDIIDRARNRLKVFQERLGIG